MKALIKSFKYAFCGIAKTIQTERNMRIHLTVTAYMLGYLLIYDFFEISRTQLAILLLMCAVVISGEMVNTAVESIADLVEKNKNIYVKTAKDAAAGAVLVSAIFAVAVGISIMWQPDAFIKMFTYYKENPLMILLLIVSLTVSALFVFKPKFERK